MFVFRHCHGAGEACGVFKGHVVVQQIDTFRNQNAPAVCPKIGSNKGGRIIGDPIANCTVVAHVNPIHHRTVENRGNVFNLDIINPDDAARWPRQVQSEMSVNDRSSPHHVDTRTRTRANNCRNFDNLTVVCQS